MRVLVFVLFFVWITIDSSVAQATFWPLSNSASTADVITSPFGPREFGTSFSRYQIHWGIDIRGDRGDPVYVIADGQVKTVGRDPNSSTGYFVDVESSLAVGNAPILIRYMHLNEEPVLNEGDWLCHYAGDCPPNSDPSSHNIVGKVGDTGTNAVHLHIAYYRDSAKLNPRLNTTNPIHILPETNRGLYQISEESMRVINEGTSSSPDYWLEFNFSVPPYQVDLERLEYDLYAVKKDYQAPIQENPQILTSRHNDTFINVKNQVDDFWSTISVDIQQQRGYIDFEERIGIDHGERGTNGRPLSEVYSFYNGIRIAPDDFDSSVQATDHRYKIRLEIRDGMIPEMLGGFELHLRAYGKNGQENVYLYETGGATNGVFIMPVTWDQVWPADLNTVPLGEERPWPNTIVVGNAGKILVATPSYPVQHATLPATKQLIVKSGGAFELEAGQSGGPLTFFTTRGSMEVESGGILKMNAYTILQVIATGRLDLNGTFDQSPNNAYLEVRDGGTSNVSNNSSFKSKIAIENGLLELAPGKTITLLDNATIEMIGASGELKVGNNTALVLSGVNTTLNLQKAGSKVYLGPDAAIEIGSGARINANGVIFTTLSGSTAPVDRWKHIKLLGGGSTFTDCTFEGGINALYNYAGSNTVERSTFLNNDRSGYVAGGTLTLKGTQVSNSGTGVLVRGAGWLVTRAWQDGGDISTFTPTRIEDATIGIDIYDYGNARLKHTRLLNNFFYHVALSGEGELFAGYYGGFASEGYNSFAPGVYYDISNSAITAQARYNWWGEASEPADSRFYGSVDRAHPLSCDPTIDGYYCSAIDEGGWDPGYCTGTGCFESNTTPIPILSQAGQNPGSSAPAAGSSEVPVKQRLSEIFSYITENPGDPAFAGLVREAYGLLQLYDPDGSIRQWAEWDRNLQDWRELYMQSKSGGPILDEHPLQQYPANLARVGETAMLLTLSDALYSGDYADVLKLSETYASYIENKDHRASLLAAKAVAWERTKQFGKALATYEQIEKINLNPNNDDGFAAPDYSVVKEELADSMEARNQARSLPLASSQHSKTKESEEIPDLFEVGAPYPNPFNPETIIPFDVSRKSRVTIKVYNMLGRQVAVLTDRQYTPGSYQVTFSANQLASGVYFIRTEMNNKLFNQKVTLIK